MRVLAALALLALPARAHADSFVELAGGVMIPTADSQWTDYVEPGLKLAARAGAVGQKAGAMLSIDWTPLNADKVPFGDISSNRFRFLVSATTLMKAAPKVHVSFRVGLGADISHVNVQTDIFGVHTENSDTDVGIALEAAGGLWFDAGSVQVGGELALPISYHDDGKDNGIDLNAYTSLDIDLLFGVRFVSK